MHLAVTTQDKSMAVSLRELIDGKGNDICWIDPEVTDNCIALINAFLSQQTKFLKLKGKKAGAKETKKK